MRILFLTNYYPPHALGGLEQSCQEVFEGLSARGHACRLLTSMHGTSNRALETEGVWRALYPEMDLRPLWNAVTFFTARKRREARNLKRLEVAVTDFKPDVIFIWGMWNLHRSLAVLAEGLLPGRVAYRFADYWPVLPGQYEQYWQHEPRSLLTILPKRILRWIALNLLARERPLAPLRFDHAMCVSAATRQKLLEAGVPISHARVIHTGLEPGKFSAAGRSYRTAPADPLTILYAGRVTEEKGVHTAIGALARIPAGNGAAVRLDIAGSGPPVYLSKLEELAARKGLDRNVRFLGRIPPEKMPELMRTRDAIVLPSIWPEPFARVVLEGMMSGMVVLATESGGTGEILIDSHNGLMFPAEDEDALAQQLERLRTDPAFGEKIARTAEKEAAEKFSHRAMLDAIEAFLAGAALEGAQESGAG